MEIYSLKKSTLGKANPGYSGPRGNNARYTGRTVVWLVVVDLFDTEVGFKRKMDAVAFAAWARVAHPDGETLGDPELAFLHSEVGFAHYAAHDFKGCA